MKNNNLENNKDFSTTKKVLMNLENTWNKHGYYFSELEKHCIYLIIETCIRRNELFGWAGGNDPVCWAECLYRYLGKERTFSVLESLEKKCFLRVKMDDFNECEELDRAEAEVIITFDIWAEIENAKGMNRKQAFHVSRHRTPILSN